MEEEILRKLRELSVRYDWETLFPPAESIPIIAESPNKSARVLSTPLQLQEKTRITSSALAFVRNREALTAQYYEQYNRIGFQDQLPKDLLITWNKRMTKSAGFTKMKRYNLSDTPRTATIELSTKVVIFTSLISF